MIRLWTSRPFAASCCVKNLFSFSRFAIGSAKIVAATLPTKIFQILFLKFWSPREPLKELDFLEPDCKDRSTLQFAPNLFYWFFVHKGVQNLWAEVVNKVFQKAVAKIGGLHLPAKLFCIFLLHFLRHSRCVLWEDAVSKSGCKSNLLQHHHQTFCIM